MVSLLIGITYYFNIRQHFTNNTPAHLIFQDHDPCFSFPGEHEPNNRSPDYMRDFVTLPSRMPVRPDGTFMSVTFF